MLEWIKENKDYASLYSAMVATGAFVFSIFTFLVSVIRAKKDRKVSDYRYMNSRNSMKKKYLDYKSREMKINMIQKKKFVLTKNHISYFVIQKLVLSLI